VTAVSTIKLIVRKPKRPSIFENWPCSRPLTMAPIQHRARPGPWRGSTKGQQPSAGALADPGRYLDRWVERTSDALH
jgi:hypothetical protein